eukprot:tig00000042_g15530.t1
MARERAAKRSRKEEPSSNATSPSVAASGQHDLNPFERLPDDVVQKIFSNLDALDAYEESMLWAVDRRFRQLLPGVLWKSISIDASRSHIPSDSDDNENYRDNENIKYAVRRSASFEKQLKRFKERLQRGRDAAAARKKLALLCSKADAGEVTANDVKQQQQLERLLQKLGQQQQIRGAKQIFVENVVPVSLTNSTGRAVHDVLMQHARRNAECIIGLLSTASTAAVPPDSVNFDANCEWWDDEELGANESLTLAHAAGWFLSALAPARVKTIRVSCSRFVEALASVLQRGCMPSLREFKAYQTDHFTCEEYIALSTDHVESRACARFSWIVAFSLPVAPQARLVAAFPELRSVCIDVEDDAALQEIANLEHLEELEVLVLDSEEDVAEALAAIAAGPSGAKLRKLILNDDDYFLKSEVIASLNAQCLASVLRCTSLEALSIPVGPDCAALLPALGRLERLKELKLGFDISGAADGGAGLLRASAALLGSLAGKGLGECKICVRAGDGSAPVDAAALSELFGAALASAPVVDFQLDRVFPAEALAAPAGGRAAPAGPPRAAHTARCQPPLPGAEKRRAVGGAGGGPQPLRRLSGRARHAPRGIARRR